MFRSLALVACLAALPCAAQKTYLDADNAGEAVGMMKSKVATAKAMLQECSARFPESGSDYARDYERFAAAESASIAKADRYWGEMMRKDASIQKVIDYAPAAVRKNLATIEEAPMPKEARDSVVRQYCGAHFKDLASGVWRSRTPRAFTFLDEAP